ncbi:MAG: hypothetical protein QOE38_1584 [Thermoleophilaceae bacterium]|nr:hypothetical protein [Thermoleophilaceae bacterium]
MTTFLIDLWHDLRERRLWPVAVGLLAAIVAVPAILFKPVSDATPPSAAAPKPSGVATLPVVTVESGPTQGSHLEAFKASEKNPFKPMKDLAKPATTTAPSGTGSAATKTASTSTSTSTSSSSGSSGSGSSSSGSSGSGSSSSGGSSTTPSSTPATTTPTAPTTEWFRYVADFSFGRSGAKAKTLTSVANFTLLPNDTSPAVVFLGVNADGKTAMFYVADAGFTADGEGTCNAQGAACRYVTLKIGQSSDEETFSAVDGSVSYDLKLLKIKRESLGSGSAPTTPKTPKATKKTTTLSDTGAGVNAAMNTAQGALPAMFAAGPGVALQQK